MTIQFSSPAPVANNDAGDDKNGDPDKTRRLSEISAYTKFAPRALVRAWLEQTSAGTLEVVPFALRLISGPPIPISQKGTPIKTKEAIHTCEQAHNDLVAWADGTVAEWFAERIRQRRSVTQPFLTAGIAGFLILLLPKKKIMMIIKHQGGSHA